MNIHRAQRIFLVIDGLLVVLLFLSFIVEPYGLLHPRSASAGEANEDWQIRTVAALKPFKHYREAMGGKILFKSPMEEEVKARQKRLIDDFEFLGSSRLGSRARGYLRNTETGESRTVAVGDSIGDFEVVEIDTNSVVLQKGDDSFILSR